MIIIDQLGRQINISQTIQSIVSLVPSHTELLAELVGVETIIGRTKFCIHPQKLKQHSQLVGGTKQLHIDKILTLKPDIIFANKEENIKEDIARLQQHIPVYVSDISTLKDSYHFIKQIGEMCSNHSVAETIITQSDTILETLKLEKKKTAAYLIWKKPYMSVGNDTYINDIMHNLGFINVFDQKNRYPETTIEEMKRLKPEVILLSSEPYPFKQSDIQELREHFATTKILLVNGEFFSWYGSRIPKLTSFLM
jgi:ABC-type Fe3+-hydroxamate transport system substrate-binding protein